MYDDVRDRHEPVTLTGTYSGFFPGDGPTDTVIRIVLINEEINERIVIAAEPRLAAALHEASRHDAITVAFEPWQVLERGKRKWHEYRSGAEFARND